MTVSENNLSPGELLIAAREKADLSLDEVAESTRIAPNMLRAIELDEYHKISGDLYVKSFLRSYAQAVGLEPEEMIELYLVYTGATNTEADGSQAPGWDEQDVKITKVGLPWGWIGLGIAILVGGYFLVSWFLGMKGDDPVAVSSTTSVPVNQTATLPDTLALGWQDETPREPVVSVPQESPVPAGGDESLPQAFDGVPSMSFAGGRQWAYVVRLLSEEPGEFSVKRDAESAFDTAEFPASLTEAIALPAENIVAGKAYAVRRGLVVYWGADDHLSLRLGHVRGVEVSFNGVLQNVDRFRDGEEILLDSSRLAEPRGN